MIRDRVERVRVRKRVREGRVRRGEMRVVGRVVFLPYLLCANERM